MSIPEPPLSAEDTQPNPAQADQPTLLRQPSRATVPTWALLVLIISVGLLLTVTLRIAFAPTENAAETVVRSVTLLVNGDRRDLTTQAVTVGQLLSEQGIQVAADDALSHTPETLLTDRMVVTLASARDVLLEINGQRQTLRTPFDHPQRILEQAGVTLDANDLLWIDGSSATLDDLRRWPVPANEIIVQRAIALQIMDGDETRSLTSTAPTVGEALYEAGIDIYLTDTVTPALDTPLREGLTITIDRARPVTIAVDGTTIETRVRGGTVADALAEAGIALIEQDYTIPDEQDVIEAGMTITVLRVTEELASYDETIPYETIYQADETLPLDQRMVRQAGQTGLQRYQERVRYENGIEVGRSPAGSEMVRVPQNEIVAYGTQIVVRQIDTPEGPREYWRKLRVYATSYHPEAVGGSTTTSIGETLRKGVVAADPDIIPYRTDVYVPGYGTGFIADTGGPRSSPYWIDLGYSDEDWVGWSRYVDIYLLTPIPANVDYLLPAWRPMRGLPDS